MLNIDHIEFKDIDIMIDYWSLSMRIALGTLDFKKKGFIQWLEISFLGVGKTLWSKVDLALKEEILASTSLMEIVDKIAYLFKFIFLGVNNFRRADSEKRKEIFINEYIPGDPDNDVFCKEKTSWMVKPSDFTKELQDIEFNK